MQHFNQQYFTIFSLTFAAANAGRTMRIYHNVSVVACACRINVRALKIRKNDQMTEPLLSSIDIAVIAVFARKSVLIRNV
jgi:hypothetical protein